MRRWSVLLMITTLVGCWPGTFGGYWVKQRGRFDVEGDCSRCVPVTGMIESAEVTGTIEPRLYELTEAVVRASSGHRLKADTVRFNGSTGAFETTQMRGYLLPDLLVVYTQGGESHDVSADHLETTRRGYELHGGDVRKGGSAVRGQVVLWITKD